MREPALEKGRSVADLDQMLDILAGIEGVQAAVVAGRDGLVIAGRQNQESDSLEAIGAMAASLVSTLDSMASDLGRGAVSQVIVELEDGLAVVQPAGALAVLTLLVGSSVNLGRVRLALRKNEHLVREAVADL
jgi:predicted regulator of Ras-like GTPase activity (Roadblock/LC7/MglB family)